MQENRRNRVRPTQGVNFGYLRSNSSQAASTIRARGTILALTVFFPICNRVEGDSDVTSGVAIEGVGLDFDVKFGEQSDVY